MPLPCPADVLPAPRGGVRCVCVYVFACVFACVCVRVRVCVCVHICEDMTQSVPFATGTQEICRTCTESITCKSLSVN